MLTAADLCSRGLTGLGSLYWCVPDKPLPLGREHALAETRARLGHLTPSCARDLPDALAAAAEKMFRPSRPPLLPRGRDDEEWFDQRTGFATRLALRRA